MGFVQVEVTHAHTHAHIHRHVLFQETSNALDAFSHHIKALSSDLFEQLIQSV